MSVGMARAMFFVYAALNGIVFSSVFILYHVTSLVFVFAATALFFGVMAVLGYTTNADFSRLRPFLLGGFCSWRPSGFCPSLSIWPSLR